MIWKDREEFCAAFRPVVTLVEELVTDRRRVVVKADAGYWTVGVAVWDEMKAFEAHAWSWDGVFDPKVIEAFIADPDKRGVILHLSDPTWPEATAD